MTLCPKTNRSIAAKLSSTFRRIDINRLVVQISCGFLIFLARGLSKHHLARKGLKGWVGFILQKAKCVFILYNKHMENIWKIHGKYMEHTWNIYGKTHTYMKYLCCGQQFARPVGPQLPPLPFRQSINQWRGNALVNECCGGVEAISLVQQNLNVEHMLNN